MNKKMYEQLQKDLAVAIKEKNISKISMIRNILEATKNYNLAPGQEKYFDQGLTGYPSVDMPWLKYYGPDAFNNANSFPKDKTVWDVIEAKLKEYYEVPTLEYFGRKIYSEEFINDVYKWASTFKALGVETDEVVPIYGPFFPEICEMTFALNAIGATPYFLKLAIGPDALAEETKDSKIAVVYDGMFKNIGYELEKDKFKKVIVATSTTGMPSPKKEIVSFISAIKSRKDKNGIPDNPKYITTDQALNIADYYTGDVKAEFKPNRTSFITSSSGTSGKVVKGTMATNETTISQLYMSTESEMKYERGGRCLNNFPPTASTSLNALYFLPLYSGLTVVVDPRVSEKDFYNQIINLKPNISIATGSLWETFFNRIEEQMKNGKKFDFSHSTGWVVGGEGTDPRKLNRWNDIMLKCGSPFGICSGYGSSELFSAVSSDTHEAVGKDDRTKAITAVGVPLAGLTVGIHDENGKELPYNTRGELWVNSPAAMKGYYGKPELTSQTKIDGIVHTGDIAEIDENGFLYIWGRKSDCIKTSDGRELYPFDIAGKIMENEAIRDAIIVPAHTDNKHSFTAHIAWNYDVNEDDKDSILKSIITTVNNYLPKNVVIVGYAQHDHMIPYSLTTFKKDRNGLEKQTTGYKNLFNGEFVNVELIPKENGLNDVKYDIIEKDIVKVRK